MRTFMSWFAAILYGLFVILIMIIGLPFAVIGGVIDHVKGCIVACIPYMKAMLKLGKKEDSKEKSEEETQNDEEVFEDLGV